MADRKSIIEFQNALRDLIPELADRFGVESLALFGSYVRQEQNAASDLDVLVTFRETPGLFKFLELEGFLSDRLGVNVDLVMQKSLKSEIGKHILKEAVPI